MVFFFFTFECSTSFLYYILSFLVSRSETGNGAGCLCYDRRERREALPHDDDQESPSDQRPPEEAHHRAQVLPGKVSLSHSAFLNTRRMTSI